MKDGFLKVGCATPEILVGDCENNLRASVQAVASAQKAGCRLLVLPELGLTGYTCSDLFLQTVLLESARGAILRLAKETAGSDMIVVAGAPFAVAEKLYNCAFVLWHGAVLGIVPKSHLPNYGEFYEQRQFQAWNGSNLTLDLDGADVPFGTRLLFQCAELPQFTLGVEICEDLWVPDAPSVGHCMAGATVIANLSASNEIVGKAEYRRDLVKGQSARLVCGYLYANAGDGESTTDVVFSGHSLIAENGTVLAESKLFENGLLCTELDLGRLAAERRRLTSYSVRPSALYQTVRFSMPLTETVLTRPFPPTPFIPSSSNELDSRCEVILNLQTAGLQKRFVHSHSKTMIIGVSGGLDSSLAVLVAARTLDKLHLEHSRLIAVTMPCFGTTARTKGNAELLAQALGATLRCIDIQAAVKQHFADIGHDYAVHDVVFENSQARERTQLLMDIANQENGLVIGTGDLSELALGWATYNGDHMSMYGVNASVPKTLIRYLVRYYALTCGQDTLKKTLLDILDTPVSPELLPSAKDGSIAQKTEDLVGPYELHDFFLYYMLRFGFSPAKIYRLARIAFAGKYDNAVILQWLRTFFRRFFQQQFKRSCLPDGPKVGSAALSPRGDWRMPSDASAALWLQEIDALKP